MIKQFFATAAALGFLCGAHAEASPFSIRATGVTGDDGDFDFTLSGDTTSTTGSLVYSEQEETSSGDGFFGTSFTDPHTSITFSDVTKTTSDFGFPEYVRTFDAKDLTFPYTVSGDGPDKTQVGYALSLAIGGIFNPDGTFAGYEPLSVSLILDGSLQAGEAIVTGNPLGLVPLPPAGLLFGTTLAGLGIAGVVRKRRAPWAG